MDDLIAFVAARLDDDEAFARQFLEGMPDEYVGDLTPVQVFALHTLADIAAKREILRMATYGGKLPRIAPTPTLASMVLDRVIAVIAQIWDHHPAYKQEWAPQAN